MAKAPKPRKQSKLEVEFQLNFQLFFPQITQPIAEHRFMPPGQKGWRFDFAWLATFVAVEMEGGTWSGGRHTRGAGFAEDCHKYNAAALRGWSILRFTSDMWANDPYGCMQTVVRMIEIRQLELKARQGL